MMTTRTVAGPPELLDLVDDLRHAPGDEGLRTALAGLLAELVPSPVRTGKLPPWLTACWKRLVPPDPFWVVMGCRRDAIAVRHEVQEMYEHAWGMNLAWDHWGTATVAGLPCVVTEPYGYAGIAPVVAMLPLADRLPCCAHAWAPVGWHHPDTSRGILFPPLVMPPPKRRPRL